MIKIYKDWNFPESQYIREATEKRQIVLHHTVSGDSVNGDMSWWLHTTERVATAYVISREGHLHRCFDDKYWAYHLGLTTHHFAKFGLNYRKLDPHAIGIELDSWGALVQHTDGKFYPVTRKDGKIVPNLKCKAVPNIYEYCSNQKYRGFQYYERYTTVQLETLKDLLRHLMNTHHISPNYKSDIWNVTSRALIGGEGIFAHASYRQDKSDVHPQVELDNLLKAL